MAKAVADPDALEKFARELKQFNEVLRQHSKRLDSQFSQLSGTWQDQEHKKFAQEYQKTMKMLRSFSGVSQRQIPLLQKKARFLREYLNAR